MRDQFDWRLYPAAERFLENQVAGFLRGNRTARVLADRMAAETSTRFFDWIDHLVLPPATGSARQLERLGFVERADGAFHNPDTIFFPVLLGDRLEVALKPEELAHFLQVQGGGEIEGELLGPYRRAVLAEERGTRLTAVERRGYAGFQVGKAADSRAYQDALQACLCRRRFFPTDAEGMRATLALVKRLVSDLEPGRAADAFFRAERLYWERRNPAGQLQRARQDRLGLGWGNHDHHTYRSSREHFSSLIHLFEAMGYRCREQFHAGEQAGWGAQILEHPGCGIVLFADVDLDVQKKDQDFAHRGLQPHRQLGTVGLWVGLHGESILQAGMHHLEARFAFDALREDLSKAGITTLPAFSQFGFLKQAFVQSPTWPVDPRRLAALFRAGSITSEQRRQFLKLGARGSHLENLQRRQGFKGFNQDSVSAIIKATDPRNLQGYRHA
ncbi:MAG: hypothetical protein HY369_02540 [Candidatus Aenigmarchaeota archaeon]|nr:hypothetical protein [Candidatus Aenigmarchaeota archaeon]